MIYQAYFYVVKQKNEQLYWLSNKKVVTIKRHLTENLRFQNLLKNRKLLPAEKFFISKKLHSDVMDFQLQQMYSCEVATKVLYQKNGLRQQLQLQYKSDLISQTLVNFNFHFWACQSQQIQKQVTAEIQRKEAP